MSTLPATIPGLVREGSHAFWRKQRVIITWVGTSTATGIFPGIAQITPVNDALSAFDLDLTGQTGIDHAARYAAETICKKIGWPVPVSVMAVHQPRMLVGLWMSMSFEGGTVRQVYFFTRPNGGDRLMDSSLNDGIPTYCTCAVDVSRAPSLTEALRLAVLAVAGVQG